MGGRGAGVRRRGDPGEGVGPGADGEALEDVEVGGLAGLSAGLAGWAVLGLVSLAFGKRRGGLAAGTGD